MTIPFIPAVYSSRREVAAIEALVLHYTATPSLEACVAIFRDPARRVSCHYVVGTDARTVQMVYDEDCAWHCGVSRWKNRERLNPWTLGIEIVNWGRLVSREEQFFCWPDEYTTPYTGLTPVFSRGGWWAPYTPCQIEQVIRLSSVLVERYRIPLDHIVRHSDIAPGRKIDPGPAFPWLSFKARMRYLINRRW